MTQDPGRVVRFIWWFVIALDEGPVASSREIRARVPTSHEGGGGMGIGLDVGNFTGGHWAGRLRRK